MFTVFIYILFIYNYPDVTGAIYMEHVRLSVL